MTDRNTDKQLLLLQLKLIALDQQVTVMRTRTLYIQEQIRNHTLRQYNHSATI